MSREGLVKAGIYIGGAAAIGATATWPILREGYLDRFNKAEIKVGIDESKTLIHDSYGIDVDFNAPTKDELKGGYKPRELTYVEQYDTLQTLLKTDLHRYPPQLVKESEIKHIRILAGDYNQMNYVFYGEGVIKLTVPGDLVNKDKARILGDGVRGQIDWLLSAAVMRHLPPDKVTQWVNLNPDKENSYIGENGVEERRNRATFRVPEYRGFISLGGMRSTIDDMAGVAQALLAGRDSAYEKARSQNDSVLIDKLELMTQLLFTASDGYMDDRYWQDLKSGVVERDPHYWERRIGGGDPYTQQLLRNTPRNWHQFT